MLEDFIAGLNEIQREQLVPAPKTPPPDLTLAMAERAIDRATLAGLVAWKDATGDLVAFDVMRGQVQRILGAYFDSLQGVAR